MGKKSDKSILENIIIANGLDMEKLARNSDAAREYVAAYTGSNAGVQMHQGLRHISESSVNLHYIKPNIKQQAGYSAEVQHVADMNAKAIIEGSDARYMRVDDLGRGHYYGNHELSANDQIYDVVQVDANNNPIVGTGMQLKFIGDNGTEWFDKMLSKKDYNKYYETDVKFGCPKDFYGDIMSRADEKIAKLKNEIESARMNGNLELANQKQLALEKCVQLKERTVCTELTNTEAILARCLPTSSAMIDILKVGGNAAYEQLSNPTWVYISGGLSIGKNLVAWFNDEKSFGEALKDSVKDVGKAGVVTGGVAAGSSMIGAILKNSSNEFVKGVGDSMVPVALALVALETGKAFKKWKDGEITGKEAMCQIRDSSVAIVGAQFGAIIGQAAIPIPIIGAMIGSVVGSIVASGVFREVMTINSQVEAAHANSLAVQAQCAQLIQQIQEHRRQMQIMAAQYMSGYIQTFNIAFQQMENSIMNDDIDMFINANNLIIEKCRGTVKFHDMNEFVELMNNDKPLIL